MTRNLYLLRHSYAEDPGSKKDKDRMLTMKGNVTARGVGRYLSKSKIEIDQVYCSTAARTRETTTNVLEELQLNEQQVIYLDDIYEASVRELLQVINAIDKDIDHALVVGHNPAISYIGEYITGDSIGGMQPAGLVTITTDMDWDMVGKNTCQFVSYFHPEE